MENLPAKPINDVKDLILHNGQTWRDLWDRWTNKVTHSAAMKELVKLSAALPHREGHELDEKAMGAVYADVLVKEGTPYFALGNAVGAFVRGAVPGQSKFFPSLPELLEECERQFQTLMKVAPDFQSSKPVVQEPDYEAMEADLLKRYKLVAEDIDQRYYEAHRTEWPMPNFWLVGNVYHCTDGKLPENAGTSSVINGQRVWHTPNLQLLTHHYKRRMFIEKCRADYDEVVKTTPHLSYTDFLKQRTNLAKFVGGKDPRKTEADKRFEEYVRAAEATRRERDEAAKRAAERRAERGIEP